MHFRKLVSIKICCLLMKRHDWKPVQRIWRDQNGQVVQTHRLFKCARCKAEDAEIIVPAQTTDYEEIWPEYTKPHRMEQLQLSFRNFLVPFALIFNQGECGVFNGFKFKLWNGLFVTVHKFDGPEMKQIAKICEKEVNNSNSQFASPTEKAPEAVLTVNVEGEVVHLIPYSTVALHFLIKTLMKTEECLPFIRMIVYENDVHVLPNGSYCTLLYAIKAKTNPKIHSVLNGAEH